MNGEPALLSIFMSRRRWLALLLIIAVAGGAWMLGTRVRTQAGNAAPIAGSQRGMIAPDVSLPAADGSQITLSTLRGKVVLLNLWASWCPPCRAEMPALNQVAARHAGSDLVILGVDATSQDNEADARAFALQQRLAFPILFDRQGAAARAYNLRSLPTTFFIGPDGVIRDIVVGGPMSEALIESKIKGLLGGGR
jgi:cytochrome c biogenesis protein CcmG/thiol:disulfide interchange protein DsbE